MTNYDRIRSMSVERMALDLARTCISAENCDWCPFGGKEKCPGGIAKGWLNWPLSEEEE